VTLLLDTHVWLWHVEGRADRLSRRIRSLIDEAALSDRVLVSVVSVWEIAQLDAANRIELEIDVRTWAARALSLPGVRLKSLSPAIAIESTRLPGEIHRDPADRFLIATARLTGATLVTADERIVDYSKTKHVRVVDARI
jgi:PIN domain nuclease of toxin-antitoxin system